MKKLLRFGLLGGCLLAVAILACKKKDLPAFSGEIPFLEDQWHAVDSLMENMDLRQKLGQLLVYQPPRQNLMTRLQIATLCEKGELGGLLIENWKLADYLQLRSQIKGEHPFPLFWATRENVAMENQFAGELPFPQPASLAAISDDSLQASIEQRLIDQMEALGINLAFGPLIRPPAAFNEAFHTDFFETRESDQLDRAQRCIQRLHNRRILSVAQGWTSVDDQDALVSALTRRGVSGFLASDELVHGDEARYRQTYFLSNYLEYEQSYSGLVTGFARDTQQLDALLHAGTDVFVSSADPVVMVDYLYRFVEAGLMSQELLDRKVRKVLLAKVWAQKGKKTTSFASKAQIPGASAAEWLSRALFQRSPILVNNPKPGLLPLQVRRDAAALLLHVGDQVPEAFEKVLAKYTSFQSALLPHALEALPAEALQHQQIIITLDGVTLTRAANTPFIRSVNHLSRKHEVVLINFGDPYNLTYFEPNLALLQVYERNASTEEVVPQIVFGGRSPEGKLPQSLSPQLPYGTGTTTVPVRLAYAEPEEVGMASWRLSGIDAIVNAAIGGQAMPGCQLMVVKEGKVIYDKAFGFHTYRRKQRVLPTDLYDLASVTKTSATTLGVMKLYEQDRFDINDQLRKLLKVPKTSPIHDLSVRKMLLHQSGLQPHMPIIPYVFYNRKEQGDCQDLFCNERINPFLVKVADEFFFNQEYQDSIWNRVLELEPDHRYKERYSDVNFFLLGAVVEQLAGQSLDEYLDAQFFQPLGLRYTTFKPLEKFAKRQITPTVLDSLFRRQLLHGYVHDETAALMGGVSGNAGLFANAGDLAVIAQMMLNGGDYGGRSFLAPTTLNYFTTSLRPKDRGLGFDKVRRGRKPSSVSPRASRETYGHSGFTGTCTWVDPDNDLIYIFLSNRVHPNALNRQLIYNRVRSRIHSVIYDALDTWPEVPVQPRPQSPVARQ